MGDGNLMQGTCPACEGQAFRKIFSKKGKDFFRCSHCRLEQQFPIPSLAELEQFYDESFAAGLYQEFTSADEMKRMTARQRLAEIQPHVPTSGKWLDVGCANGVFVEALSAKGVDSHGVELSQNAVQAGRERGLSLHLGTVDDLDESEVFDCITGFDVLEHVTDPVGFVQSIYHRLQANGHLVLTVPDTGCFVRRLMGRRWFFYIPEEHLFYFNRRNLKRFLERLGFEVVNVGATHKPMTYDYAMTQFAEYNPLIYKMLKVLSFAVPAGLRKKPIPLPIGEIRIVARKTVEAAKREGRPAQDVRQPSA